MLAEQLAGALRHATISYRDESKVDDAAFAEFHAYLAETFPLVHEHLTPEEHDLSLVFRWEGADPTLPPVLLLAHQDVAPIAEGTLENWSHPPFAGAVAEGFVWGRGAIDDKASLVGILAAAEHLLKQGYRPPRTVYFAFGQDEEVGGARGAVKLAEHFAQAEARFACILDEGCFIGEDFAPVVRRPIALVGVAEKGYLTLQLTAHGPEGHSSLPPGETATDVLAAGLVRLHQQPFPASLEPPLDEFLSYLGPEMPLYVRVPLANRWLFDPVVRWQFGRKVSTAAMLRTTAAITVLDAGDAENVLPPTATATVNCRIRPGESIAGTMARVEAVLADERITVVPVGARSEPSPVTPITSDGYRWVERAAREAVPEAVVVPALLVATSDSRHYAGLSDTILRFAPLRLGRADLARIHGTDERLGVEDFRQCVAFYVRLLAGLEDFDQPASPTGAAEP